MYGDGPRLTGGTVTVTAVAPSSASASTSTGAPVAPVPVVSAYPDPITLPVSPHGDPDAARTLAAAYRTLADDLDTCTQHVDAVITDLALRWQGHGSTALHLPQETLDHNLSTLAAALRQAAGHLDDYATALHRAQHHHGWSIGRILTVGAIVAVTTVAVVVTVGAAAPVGTAAAVEVGEAIAGAEAAAGAATAAETAATTAMSLAATAMTTLRTLAAVALPHLTQGGISAGIDTGLHLVTGRPITATDLSEAFLAGTLGSATTTATRNALHASDAYANAGPVASAALDTAALTATLTTDTALSEYTQTGHLNPTALTEDALLTATTGGVATLHNPTSATAAITSATSSGRPPAGQTLADLMNNGVDLTQHEGPYPLGHTLEKHVGKTVQWLRLRLASDPRATSASTFADTVTAEQAISVAMADNATELLQVATIPGDSAQFQTDVGHVIGTVVGRNGTVRASSIVIVRVSNMNGRIVVRTAYVGNP